MPDLMQPLAKHVFFPLFALKQGSSVPRHLREFERSQYFSPDRIAAMQLERLRALLGHAYRNCPFYTRRFDEAGLVPSRVQSIDDLRVLPVLTKKDIQTNLARLTAQNLPPSDLVPDKTGGSTGQPLNFFINQDRVYSRNAAALRHDRWTGWDIGCKTAYLWGHHGDLGTVARLKNRIKDTLLDRNLILDTASITAPKLEQFRKGLLKFRPVIYVGYANSVYLYARFLRDTGVRDYHRPSAIITSAELLDPEQRQVIEKVFGCKVFDRYGSRETSIIASECDRHTGLHVCAETILLEIVADNQPAQPGQLGKIIITDLMNYGMPFIRYRIEDIGRPSPHKSCSCGRGLPLIDMAAGRVTDFLVTPDGKIISGASLTIFLIANTPGLAQAQFVQERKDELIMRIVKGEKFNDESLRYLNEQIPEFFGPKVKYHFEYVDSIPPEPSGKHRFSLSKLDISEMF
ncbi:MAG: phenylacetate--CoA ligase family protein [Candidatus Zixiibacteriota bacterium]